eukprot:712935-Pyramimonas_sp.AAC.1
MRHVALELGVRLVTFDVRVVADRLGITNPTACDAGTLCKADGAELMLHERHHGVVRGCAKQQNPFADAAGLS